MNLLQNIETSLELACNKEKAETLKKFFKTNKGEYGEGDIFIGVTVPQIRVIVKKFWQDISFEEIEQLLQSKINEKRALALLFLVKKFEKTKIEIEQEKIINFYLNEKNIKQINNWNLVDLSCYKILGRYLLKNPNKIDILYEFSKCNNLWKRRISIVTTFAFIKEEQFKYTIDIINILMLDKHNLIHKANGWMLREIGKKNKEFLLDFLDKNASKMPRITLSYSIEKLTEKEKKFYRTLK